MKSLAILFMFMKMEKFVLDEFALLRVFDPYSAGDLEWLTSHFGPGIAHTILPAGRLLESFRVSQG